MELWFWLVVGSAVFTGLQTFTYKIAAMRDYDAPLLNAYGALISGFLLLFLSLFLAPNFYLSNYVLLLSFITAVLYLISNISRHRALQAIDTAIFFPIYKVVGPALVIVSGLVIFSESFTKLEWAGLLLSLMVPGLLLSRSEKYRQNDLWRGVKLLLFTTVLTVLAALTTKEMAVQTDNIWFLVAVGDLLLAFTAVLIFWKQSNGNNPVLRAREHTNKPLIILSMWLGILQAFSFVMIIFAYREASLGIVYTIHSLYILIPIILSIIYYNEHWNARKVTAIILSIAALALLK